MKSESAILANGKVNVSLIEKEIANELGADAKYHAEDEMKKKAVHTSEWDDLPQYSFWKWETYVSKI